MRNTLLFIVLITVLYSCKEKGINDLTRRNENWVWFVDKTTGQGIWAPIGKHTTLGSGTYTAFYYNGKIREKGKLAETQQVDTIYYFDLNEQLAKYTVLGTDSSIQYYVNNGPYKGYSAKGELTEEGMVKEHKITNEKWYGPFEHFVEVFVAIEPAKLKFAQLAKKIKEAVIESGEAADSTLAPEKIKQIDTLYTVAYQSALTSLEQLNKIKNLNEMPELKAAALNGMTGHKSLIEIEFAEIISLIKKGLKEKNRATTYSVLSQFVEKDKANERFLKAQSDFQSQFEFSEEQNEFLNRKFKDILDN